MIDGLNLITQGVNFICKGGTFSILCYLESMPPVNVIDKTNHNGLPPHYIRLIKDGTPTFAQWETLTMVDID